MAVLYSQSFSNERLLVPLAGIFAALMISAAGEAVPNLPPPPDLTQYPIAVKEAIVLGYDNLGASSLAAVGALSSQSEKALNQAETAVTSSFIDLKTNFSLAGEEFMDQFLMIIKNLENFFVNVWVYVTTSLDNLYANLFSGIGFLLDRLEILGQGPINKTKNLVFQTEVQTVLLAESLQTNVNYLAALGSLNIENAVGWINVVKMKLSLWGDSIVQAWRSFIGLDTQTVAVPIETGFTSTDRADLNQIKQNVGTILELINQEPVSRGPSQGMVVLPTTGSVTSDQQLKNQVANMFSDKVSVQLDESRKSGVITPVFKEGAGNNYIFLLAPVNQ